MSTSILITGGKGFLARELIRYFSNSKNHYNIIVTDRSTLNPTVDSQVKKLLEEIDIDFVIHTAVKGGKRNDQEKISNLFENISMFNNLSNHSDKYKLMFNFGSGAEFDRRYPIRRLTEENVYNRTPQDYYGLAKNMITRRVLELDKNIINMRLFGCFGPFEEEQRLFKATYNKLQADQQPVIFQDREMDFFYSQDVGAVIEHYILNYDKPLPKDINLCYNQKYNISDLVSQLKVLTNSPSGVIIESPGTAPAYSGHSFKLDQLKIDFKGLERGLEECLKNWNKS
tara:strand:- start:5270 stop:6124 length:855 start_codon:yes stop_codon:yes gene_type:complete